MESIPTFQELEALDVSTLVDMLIEATTKYTQLLNKKERDEKFEDTKEIMTRIQTVLEDKIKKT